MSFCRTKRILPYGVVVKTSQLVFLMVDFKKLQGRPRLKEGKRIKKIDTRFTEEEYKQVLALEQQFGISKTELVRMRLLTDANKIIVNAKELIRLLDEIGSEMGRSGNNINQLAKHANTLKLAGTLPVSVADRFNLLLDQHIQVQQSLESALRKIIRLMGK
jgi:putative heme degradation protein